MPNTRRLRALAALAFTLVLAACSTDNDLTAAPELAPQFGTANDDFGIDTVVTSTRSVAVLSQEDSYYYNGDYDVNTSRTDLLWKLYDNSGTLAWESTVDSVDCAYADYNGYSCYHRIPKKLVADKKGNTYALVMQVSDDGYTYDYTFYRLYKFNSSGTNVSTFYLGDFSGEYYGVGIADVAVDGTGNIYAINQQTVSNSPKDVIKKLYASGSQHLQRLSPVGIPYGITVTAAGNVYAIGSTGMARLSNAGVLAWTKTGTSYAVSEFSQITSSGTNIFVRNKDTVRKYDANGKLLWSKVQGGLNTLVTGDITADATGNLYLGGKFRPTSSSPADVFARKLNASGATVWTKTFGTSGTYDDGRGIATINGSEIYVTGETQGSLAHTNMGGRDGYLRKLNSTGNPVWTR